MQGLRNIRASLESGLVEVVVERPVGSFAGVARAIENLGFQISPLPTSEEDQSLQKKMAREEIMRIGVAAFCATNIMMFAFAVYAGASAEFERLFSWLSFALYIPVVSYVAVPFYRGAYRALKQRSLSIDLPMAVASLAGFIFSTINLVRGQGSIYFDSLSGFLLLILVTRFFQKKLQRSALQIDLVSSLETLSRARILAPGTDVKSKEERSWKWIPTALLNKENLIYLVAGDLVPVDGRVKSDKAVVDSSFLTGESHPRILNQGMKIPAGAMLKNPEAIVEVEATGFDTDFGKLLKTLRENSMRKSQAQNLSDKWSQVLLVAVFAVAIVFLVGYWFVSPQAALERSLALIILACPCAMAFGTPLAMAFSLKSAAKKGFVLKSADVFEKALTIKNIFLDKTGTLTHRKMMVRATSPVEIPADWRSIVLGLESQSYHPIAEGLRDFLTQGETLPNGDLDGISEVPGRGVKGFLKGALYELRSSEMITGEKSVGLYCDGDLLAHFYFEDPLMPGARSLVQEFQARQMDVYLVSGDQKTFVDRVASDLKIPEDKVYSERTPSEKAFLVQQHPLTMMIGDGVNDTAAFQRAELGVAVKGSVEMALQSSDIYFLSDHLENIPQIFDIARRAHSLIRHNLMISVAYNLLAGTGALLGMVNPFVAAVLMPISSGVILLHTWWRTRN
jgi:Cu2+-exporting ATPase/Cu+-exporting ATPase